VNKVKITSEQQGALQYAKQFDKDTIIEIIIKGEQHDTLDSLSTLNYTDLALALLGHYQVSDYKYTKGKLELSFNYDALEQSIGKECPIYLSKDNEYNEEDSMELSIDEALWLSEKLRKMADELKVKAYIKTIAKQG
jgi:hypothetical protein